MDNSSNRKERTECGEESKPLPTLHFCTGTNEDNARSEKRKKKRVSMWASVLHRELIYIYTHTHINILSTDRCTGAREQGRGKVPVLIIMCELRSELYVNYGEHARSVCIMFIVSNQYDHEIIAGNTRGY